MVGRSFTADTDTTKLRTTTLFDPAPSFTTTVIVAVPLIFVVGTMTNEFVVADPK